MLAVRIFVDPTKPDDLAKVHALQDAIKIEPAGTGILEISRWDQVSQKKIRDALLVLASTILDAKGMFGVKGQVDPIRHLIGTTRGWDGNPAKDAT